MYCTRSDGALNTHASARDSDDASAPDSDDASARDSDSGPSDEDRIGIRENGAHHLADSTDHTSHLEDHILVYKLSHHRKPLEHVEPAQGLCISNLIKQCKTALNTLDSNVMRMQSMMYCRNEDFNNRINSMIVPVKEEMKMYTAALISHVERRDAGITSLNKKLLEGELKCRLAKESTIVSERPNTTEAREARAKMSMTLVKSSFISIQPIPCKHKEATPSVASKGTSGQTEEYKMASQPVLFAKETSTKSLEFLQQDLEHQSKRIEQRQNALRALEKAKRIEDGERQAMQHKIQTLQEEVERFKHTVADRDATLSASYDLIRQKNAENEALKKNERQQADIMDLLRHAGVEKDRKLVALRNEGSEQAHEIESLRGTVALREREYKELEVIVANRNTERVVLRRRIHELEGEAEAKPSNKRARVD